MGSRESAAVVAVAALGILEIIFSKGGALRSDHPAKENGGKTIRLLSLYVLLRMNSFGHENGLDRCFLRMFVSNHLFQFPEI